MSTEHLKRFFHKDNSTVIIVTDCKLAFLKRSMVDYNNTLPIEVLHLFKCFKYIEIKSLSTMGGLGPQVEFIGRHEGKGFPTAHQNDPVFWERLIDMIINCNDNYPISEELDLYYVPKEELYTMEQVIHLVNVIRGDLANQPKLLKKILNMEIDK